MASRSEKAITRTVMVSQNTSYHVFNANMEIDGNVKPDPQVRVNPCDDGDLSIVFDDVNLRIRLDRETGVDLMLKLRKHLDKH